MYGHTYVRTDGRTESPCILQDFVPSGTLRGRCLSGASPGLSMTSPGLREASPGSSGAIPGLARPRLWKGRAGLSEAGPGLVKFLRSLSHSVRSLS